MTARHQLDLLVTSAEPGPVTSDRPYKQALVTTVTSVTSEYGREYRSADCGEVTPGVLPKGSHSSDLTGDTGDSGDQPVKQGRFGATSRQTGLVATDDATGGNPIRPALDEYGEQVRQAEGLRLYALARRLDALAQGPLERLAEFFPCPQCSAPAGGPCDGAEDPEAIDRALALDGVPEATPAAESAKAAAETRWSKDGATGNDCPSYNDGVPERTIKQLRAINRAPDACAARLEDAAAARAEWIALRSPDGRAWARVWDRRVARSAARSALWKAAQGLEGAETNDTRPDDREGQQTAAEAEEMDR